MNQAPKPTDAARLLAQLQRHQQSVHKPLAGNAPFADGAVLCGKRSAWQAPTPTYSAASATVRAVASFWIMSTPHDFSQRDHDVERMYQFMLRFLPERLLHTLTLTIELNRSDADWMPNC